MFKVNTKERGDVFGEISLMYDCPRSATVAATTDASVFVLERDVFRQVCPPRNLLSLLFIPFGFLATHTRLSVSLFCGPKGTLMYYLA